MINLTGKVAIVTGAARGLGFGIAEKLVNLNATVIINDIDKAGVDAAVKTLEQNDGKVFGYVCNVANEQQVNEFVDQVLTENERIDILVNNAGINRDGMLHKMTSEQWKTVLDVNLTGVFHMTQPISKIMREQNGGRIINISSASWLGNVGQANYAAAKAGVVGLTKTAARELARYDVTANAICPGFIDTDMTRGVPEKVWDMMVSKIPAGRAGKPEDVANCISFLASDQASYINGEVINVGGGMVL
ncbi:3-oxoacyl-ACP reductase FabG [Pseudalkalibacillus sp. JSM 102089]|uniref:3-oxoacyl-ACP reductase FabG n=1 Tax=Pseudalkalibacillus sp. JSM 102089 TaxID=3229856 RepID=UPI003524D658